MTYTVKPGDTLYGISNQFGVSATELAKVNNITTNIIKVGQILTIPNNSGTNPDSIFIYTVVKGDNLYNLASRYNITVKDIMDLNNLKSSNLSIGQKLRIPEKYNNANSLPNYINYIVKKGDNLSSIAKKYGTTVEDIMNDNNLKNTNLQIGDNLKIRVPNTDILECIGISWEPNDTSNLFNYTVVKGDSLYKIANKYDTTVSDIIKLNNLNNNDLSVGQILKIPMSNNNTYIVKKGDSLYTIAKNYGTTVNNIIALNNLKSTNLSIGQVLKISNN